MLVATDVDAGGDMVQPQLLPAADLIREFVNTRNVEKQTDELSSPAALAHWLRQHGLLGPRADVDEEDRRLAVALREALRETLLTHHGSEGEPAAPDLEQLAGDLPLRLAFPAGGPRLEPAAPGVRGALAALVAAVYQAVADGSWSRLKACPADDCTWAFYDASKNRSRTWCSMEVCGNRAKTRTFRARHTTA
jgi:predicted RNA-binding Zn ribbon-like protein